MLQTSAWPGTDDPLGRLQDKENRIEMPPDLARPWHALSQPPPATPADMIAFRPMTFARTARWGLGVLTLVAEAAGCRPVLQDSPDAAGHGEHSNKAAARVTFAHMNCVGGPEKRRWERAPSRLLAPGFGKPGGSTLVELRIARWEMTDGDRVSVAVWMHEGTSIETESRPPGFGYPKRLIEEALPNASRELESLCPYDHDGHRYIAEGVLDKPGLWEVVVVHSELPTVAVKFKVLPSRTIEAGRSLGRMGFNSDEAVEVDVVPRETPPELAARLKDLLSRRPVAVSDYPHPMPATPEELRAMVRSREVLTKRLELNEKVRFSPLEGKIGFAQEEHLDLSPEQKFHRGKQARADAKIMNTREYRERVAKARTTMEELKKLIAAHGAPFELHELPRFEEAADERP